MQRYRCKNSHKTFTATTNTPLSWLHHKDKWKDYFKTMIESKALRQSVKECGIDLKTVFRWHHRFLQLPSQIKAKLLEGIIESTSIDGISKQLAGKIEKDSILCSDGYMSYIQFAQVNGLVHKQLNLSAGV